MEFLKAFSKKKKMTLSLLPWWILLGEALKRGTPDLLVLPEVQLLEPLDLRHNLCEAIDGLAVALWV